MTSSPEIRYALPPDIKFRGKKIYGPPNRSICSYQHSELYLYINIHMYINVATANKPCFWVLGCHGVSAWRGSRRLARSLQDLLQSLRKVLSTYKLYVGNCQNYGPFLGPYYNMGPNTGPNLGDPKRDHNFDSSPCILVYVPYIAYTCIHTRRVPLKNRWLFQVTTGTCRMQGQGLKLRGHLFACGGFAALNWGPLTYGTIHVRASFGASNVGTMCP